MNTPTPTPRTDRLAELDITTDGTWIAHAQQLERELTAKCDQLRAEVEWLKTFGIVEIAASNSSVLDYYKHWEDRAVRAEAELATERARLDWLEKRGPWESWIKPPEEGLTLRAPIRAAIDAAMKECTL